MYLPPAGSHPHRKVRGGRHEVGQPKEDVDRNDSGLDEGHSKIGPHLARRVTNVATAQSTALVAAIYL